MISHYTLRSLTNTDTLNKFKGEDIAIINEIPSLSHAQNLLNLTHALGRPTTDGLNTNNEYQYVEHQYIYLVQQRKSPALDKNGFVIKSTSNDKMNCHTDAYIADNPCDAVLLYAETIDEHFGHTIYVTLESLVSHLDPTTAKKLTEPVYPTLKGTTSILFKTRNELNIRYSRYDIERLLAGGRVLEQKYMEALNALDKAIVLAEKTFSLERGQCLFLNNKKILHGRTALSENSPRNFKRIRFHFHK